MPKVKQKSGRNAEETLCDDEESVSATQATQSSSQAQSSISSLSNEEIQTIVGDLVHYLLIADQKKIPIKRQDINKHVLKQYSRAFNIFMKKAQERLNNIFGIDVIEIEGKQKPHVLVNLIENDAIEPHLQWSGEENSKIGLLIIILAVIFMKGNVIVDSQLYYVLRTMGVDIDMKHEVFDDVKKLITQEFVRQGYLEYIRDAKSDPPAYEFQWGPRAKVETCKRNILQFVCQIYDVGEDFWTSQYQDMLRSEAQ